MNVEQIEQIAQVCHEANKAYCATIGDLSMPAWSLAPDWQRASCIKGVEFCVANPDVHYSALHESWLRTKEAEGWAYGEMKDPENKPHPSMLPFADLPAEHRAKDVLFQAIVRALVLAENGQNL